MNNTFSFARFTQLFIRHTVANYKAYLLSLAMLMGVLFLLIGYGSTVDGTFLSESTQYLYFIFFFLLSGAIFTSGIFSELNDKRKTIPYLMLPASNFEKYLVAWIYSYVIFQLIFIGGFYVVECIVFSISNNSVDRSGKILNIFADKGFFNHDILIFSILHSVAFFGAVFFKKLNFIKTTTLGFAMIVVIMLVHNTMINIMFPEGISASEPFSSLTIMEGNNRYYIEQLSAVSVMIPYLMLGLSILLWMGTYFKLKEKEA